MLIYKCAWCSNNRSVVLSYQPNHLPSPSCLSLSRPNTSSILLLVRSKDCLKYVPTSYFSARLKLGSIYFITDPSDIVKINLFPHFLHFPIKGGLPYFSLHFTHLNSCPENFRRFHLMSRIKCFSITKRATSAAFTARILSARSICPRNLSSMLGSVLYAEQMTPAFISEVS